jgi:hypothetical protein
LNYLFNYQDKFSFSCQNNFLFFLNILPQLRKIKYFHEYYKSSLKKERNLLETSVFLGKFINRFAGGFAGAMSRTIVAPLERIKLIL